VRRFPHGVASGEPTTDSVLLWTRVDPASEVQWELRGDDVERSGTVIADPDADATVRLVVTGLPAGRTFTYAFSVDGERVEGVTATVPERADRFRIGVVCCARWGWNDFDAYRRLADAKPDLVLHLGDYIYEIGEDPPCGPRTEPPHDARTLADYRTRFAQHRAHPAVLALHAAAPMIALWDDHEVADNAPTRNDPASRERRAAGLRAWREWMPIAVGPAEEPLDRTLSVGGLFDLTVIDARFTGREPGDTSGPSTPDDDRTLLSDAQWETLEERARDASAPWHLIANQVQVGPTRLAYVPSLRPPFVRPLVNPDQWDGFPQERARLFDLLRRGSATPLLLSGDLHSAWSRRLDVGHELTCPSVAGETYADAFRSRTHLPPWVLRTAIRTLNRGIDLLRLDGHGCLLLDVRPDVIAATFSFDDGDVKVRLTR
jgi:alkaline phosphatase D